MNKILELKQIKRHFGVGETKVSVLKGIDFSLKAGEVVALLGPSGSGKSTLLQIAGLLDTPNSGSVFVDGQAVNTQNDAMRTQVRRDTMGFVYQSHLLLNDFSALENVMMPMLIAGKKRDMAQKRALFLLERMGLKKRVHHRPGQMSGGEQQRVAIARALITQPKLLLADEPTGSLDEATGQKVMDLFFSVCQDLQTSFILVTHNRFFARRTNRVFCLKKGALIDETC